MQLNKKVPGQVVYYLAGDFFVQLHIISAPILKSLALNCKKFSQQIRHTTPAK